MEAPRLPKKPVARSEKVEDLVEMVYRGRVRVPSFQRGLKWDSSDVQALFDSVYRGYPIGSLLFYQRPAEAESIRVGPLKIGAPEEAKAWWVVDGQQRLTALTACLARSVPLPDRPEAEDHYVLYFDVDAQEFRPPPKMGEIPTTWVPLPKLLDASELTEWTFGWKHGGNADLRRRLFEAGSRIREYPVPLYVIEADLDAATQIFYRTNKAGKPLKWEDVHKALFAGERSSPSTLSDLGDELEEVGMGRLSEDRLLTALFGLRGLDPTRTLGEHYRQNPTALENAVQEVLPVLRRVLSFLRRDAEIHHLRLLPKPILLDVLTRFFALHPEPAPRTRILLARWFWRTALGAGGIDDRTLRRSGIRVINEKDEEGSVQKLLKLTGTKCRSSVELPDAFDGRSDTSRIILATLAHLEPRHLDTGQPLDVATLVNEQDHKAFVKIIKEPNVPGVRGSANRILHPKGLQITRMLLAQREPMLSDGESILASHAIPPPALVLLREGNLKGFLDVRLFSLTMEVNRFASRLAAWDQNDRPSIAYILGVAEADAS